MNLTGKNRELIANADVIMGLDMTDLYGALVRSDPNTHANVPATKPGCKVINVTLKDIVVRSWTSDFQELAPVDVPIVANTRVFLPALAEEIRKQGKFSRSVVDDRRKALAAQHEEVHARWQDDLKKRWDEKPISPPRLAWEIWEALKKEDWILVAGAFRGWPSRLWTWDKPGLFLGGYGGGGLGYGPAASVGASLPYRGTGKICVNLQRDGEMLYTPSAHVDRGQHGVPLLDGDDQQSGLLQRRRASGKSCDSPRPAGGKQAHRHGDGQAAGGFCQSGAHLSVFTARGRSPNRNRFARRWNERSK